MKAKTVFFCTECGNETARWQGQCPACHSWNTLVEQPAESKVHTKTVGGSVLSRRSPIQLDSLTAGTEQRFDTGLGELNRVLGGGAVQGSLILVGGAPGVGKSTLLLQICRSLRLLAKVLYVTGEESEGQLKMRADRLDVHGNNLFVMSETDVSHIIETAEEEKPEVLIIDSIQTMYSDAVNAAPGSVSQVKQCTLELMGLAKGSGITVFVIGHVNKEGAIAGPRVLEHMVDCVLYFEGSNADNHRILRSAKNRFGSTNEIGVFEMADDGLREVPNPSEMLLSGRPKGESGTCVACVMEGTRPVLAEVQSLLSPTGFNQPRRSFNGMDFNRAMLLLAVLEKRCGLKVSSCDAYINVIGGLNIDDPSADLATAIAIASSYRDRPVSEDLAAVGEIGLTGELRAVRCLSQRLSEIRRLGFTACVIPKQGTSKITAPPGLTLLRAATVGEALKLIL